MTSDTNGPGEQSPILMTIAACGALVTLSAMWLLIAFSDLCCCIRRRRERCQETSSTDEQKKYNTVVSGASNDDEPADGRSKHDSVQYIRESSEKGLPTDEARTKRANNKTIPAQRSEKKNVFHLRKESKKATSQQDLDVTMKDRISAFESTDSVKSVPTQEKDAIKPKKKKPSSKAFQEFERSGIIIGFGKAPKKNQEPSTEETMEDQEPSQTDDSQGQGSNRRLDLQATEPSHNDNIHSNTNSLNRLTDDEGIHMTDEEDEFSAVPRQSEILKSFRRAPPPKNRSRANRALQKRISTRRETENFPGFDFPAEQDEESVDSVVTTVSRSTDSIVTPSDRVTPDNDTTTSGHHTGEDSPSGTSPDSANKDTTMRRTSTSRHVQQMINTRDDSLLSESGEKHIILLVDNSAKDRTGSEQTMMSQQQDSTTEVKEVSFKDFMALIQRSNSKDVGDGHGESDHKMAVKTERSSLKIMSQPETTSASTRMTSSQTSSGRSSIQSDSWKVGKQSNQNNNNTSETIDVNTTAVCKKEPCKSHNGQLVLTRPRSFQPTSFSRIRDSPSIALNQNVDFPARSRFSSVANYKSQQVRVGTERSRSMSVGSVALAAKNKGSESDEKRDANNDSAKKHDVKDDDKTVTDDGERSFQETAI